MIQMNTKKNQKDIINNENDAEIISLLSNHDGNEVLKLDDVICPHTPIVNDSNEIELVLKQTYDLVNSQTNNYNKQERQNKFNKKYEKEQKETEKEAKEEEEIDSDYMVTPQPQEFKIKPSKPQINANTTTNEKKNS